VTDLTPQGIGLLTAIIYAISIICARRGLQYSNPITVTLVSVTLQSIVLWAIVLAITGIPPVSTTFVVLAFIVGLLMPLVRLLSYTGIAKIGAARGASLRSTHPLFSTLIALSILGESATLWVLAGILLIVAGITLISWQRDKTRTPIRWWDALYSIAAAILAAVVHNITRVSLQNDSYPILFAAIVGLVSLTTTTTLLKLGQVPETPSWNRRSLGAFLATAALENLGFLTFALALSLGPVVLVTPMIATQPMWVLLFTVVFLRNIELVRLRTLAGSGTVLGGTLAITLGSN